MHDKNLHDWLKMSPMSSIYLICLVFIYIDTYIAQLYLE